MIIRKDKIKMKNQNLMRILKMMMKRILQIKLFKKNSQISNIVVNYMQIFKKCILRQQLTGNKIYGLLNLLNLQEAEELF